MIHWGAGETLELLNFSSAWIYFTCKYAYFVTYASCLLLELHNYTNALLSGLWGPLWPLTLLLVPSFPQPQIASFFFFLLFLKGCWTTSPCPGGSLCQRGFSPEIHFPLLALHHLKGFAQTSFPSESYLEHPFSCCSCCPPGRLHSLNLPWLALLFLFSEHILLLDKLYDVCIFSFGYCLFPLQNVKSTRPGLSTVFTEVPNAY